MSNQQSKPQLLRKAGGYSKEDVIGYEHVFSTYCANASLGTDALVVKENVHLKNGTIKPQLRIFPDRKWPFYVTKKGFQNHQDKKEYEFIERLDRYHARRIDLPRKIKQVTNNYNPAQSTLRNLSENPYLYGTDILPTSLIKAEYDKRWKDIKVQPRTVAALDTETDVVNGTNEIIICGVAYIDPVTKASFAYTAITEEWAKSNPNIVAETRAAGLKYAPDEVKGLCWVIEVVKNAGESVKRCLDNLHRWQPDFVSIYNIDYDMPIMKRDLEKYGYDPAQVFSDPSVPDQYKFFEYTPGQSIKVTQDGSKMSIHVADRWHVTICPASFYFIDSMCLYKRIRVAKANEPSYGLNDILAKNGLASKLRVAEVAHLEADGDTWHYTMQKETWLKPIYVVYNLIDNLRLLQLDFKTGDICRAFPALAGISDFGVFNKNPRRIVDDLHFFFQERGRIIASTSPTLKEDPLNKYIVPMSGWIITLASYLIQSPGSIIQDAPHLRSLVYRYLADLDITGTYPTEEDILNISKETTMFETCRIQGLSLEEQRQFSINLTGGKSNALEIAIRYLNCPTQHQMLAKFDEDYPEYKEKMAA